MEIPNFFFVSLLVGLAHMVQGQLYGHNAGPILGQLSGYRSNVRAPDQTNVPNNDNPEIANMTPEKFRLFVAGCYNSFLLNVIPVDCIDVYSKLAHILQNSGSATTSVSSTNQPKRGEWKEKLKNLVHEKMSAELKNITGTAIELEADQCLENIKSSERNMMEEFQKSCINHGKGKNKAQKCFNNYFTKEMTEKVKNIIQEAHKCMELESNSDGQNKNSIDDKAGESDDEEYDER